MAIEEGMPDKVGPYRIEARLGRGGMGDVYRAYDERLGRRVALKQIRLDKAADPSVRARFRREARAAAQLNHPALVQVHDILSARGVDWIVMELVEGDTLARRMAAGPLAQDLALGLAFEMASGLAAAHAHGIVHRDLKSQNVVVTTTGHAKILDFGLAKTRADTQGIRPERQRILGTPIALSPEQAAGLDVDHRSDLFSLGTLLYEMFSGRSPHRGPGLVETLAKLCIEAHVPLHEYAPDVPRALSKVVDQLLAKEPAARPSSAAAVAKTIQDIITNPFDRSGFQAGLAETEDVQRTRAQPHLDAVESNAAESATKRPWGEHRQMTVVCCDLVRSETATALDPEHLYQVLPAFHRIVQEVTDQFWGHLGNRMGHRVILYFGYPQAREDDVRRAVLAAREIIIRSRMLVTQPGAETSENLAARAGIHTGSVVLLRRAKAHDKHLALGQTLEFATSVQECAATGEIVVSTATHRLLGDDVERRALPPRSAIEREARATLYRVVGLRADRSRADRPPLVGRRGELELCLDRSELALQGAGQVLLVGGEAGIGKTRLVLALRDSTAGKRWRWLEVQGTSHPPSSVHPLTTLLRQVLDLDPEGNARHRRDRLENALQRVGVTGAEILPRLTALLEAPASSLDLAAVAPTSVPWQTALAALVLGAAEHRPIALAFEDLQWLDAAALEVIGELILHGSATTLLLVLTSRPSFRYPWGHHEHVTRLHLHPLDSPSVSSLMEQLGGGQPLPSAIRKRIVDFADGVPRSVEAIARDALDADETGALPSRTVPWKLRDGFMSELDRLGSAKEIVLLASLLGREFSLQELAVLAGLEWAELEREIDRLVVAEVLFRLGGSPTGRCRFRRALLWQTAVTTLLIEDRQALQRQPRSDAPTQPAG